MQLLILVVLLVFTVSIFGLVYDTSESSDILEDFISVSGESKINVGPDQAELYIRTETRAQDVKEAQRQNNDIMNKVRDALKKIDIKNIETIDFSLQPIREWDPNTNRYIDNGFIQTHTFKVTTTKIDQAGDIINVAVENGANSIDNIIFSLSEDKLRETKTKVISDAVKNAKYKAQAMAEGANIRLGKVKSITENNFVYTPYYRDMVAEKVTVPVEPKQVELSANVQVDFEI